MSWLSPDFPSHIQECFFGVREDGTIRFDAFIATKLVVLVSTIVSFFTVQFFVETYRFTAGAMGMIVGQLAFLYIPLPPECRDDPLWMRRLLHAAHLPIAGSLAGFGEALLIWLRKSTFDHAAAQAGVAAADFNMLEILLLLFSDVVLFLMGTCALLYATYAVYLCVTSHTSIRDRLVDEELQIGLIADDAADKTPDALNPATSINDDEHSDANAAMNDHHHLHASTDHTLHAGNSERPASGRLDFTAAASLGGGDELVEGCDKRV